MVTTSPFVLSVYLQEGCFLFFITDWFIVVKWYWFLFTYREYPVL
ncbi:hypothetical protein HMPREF0766_13392 [Sphingobacterium spiritivorum ATCC 33861]|uniref:Uncharacterized protein n=1 Tax=Sphingobacterium spiritivorum ATCC 33861 TaxID=525373 RepID=D7VQY8_SPHSI|nr:hypothetical protein HMPREF0766_13392 [Sphingobacterium spiritivorum ATCC 33861]